MSCKSPGCFQRHAMGMREKREEEENRVLDESKDKKAKH